mgnify:CR=1 FL=1
MNVTCQSPICLNVCFMESGVMKLGIIFRYNIPIKIMEVNYGIFSRIR